MQRPRDAAKDRTIIPPHIAQMEEFLNHKDYENESNVSTIWIKAREASKNLKLTWHLSDGKKASVVCGIVIITDKRKIFNTIRAKLRKDQVVSLRSKRSQGKTD